MAEVDLIVIGAGVSGLAAARDACKAGLRVLVLEGRAGIGGRVRADDAGLGMDVGAAWLPGHGGHPVYEELKRAGVAMKPFNYENSWLYDRSGEVEDAVEERIEDVYEPIDGAVRRLRRPPQTNAGWPSGCE